MLTPENLNYDATKNVFNRAADHYDDAAVISRHAADELLSRTEWLRLIPERILDAGCGSGYGLQGLRQRYPKASITGVDISPAMLQKAENKSIKNIELVECPCEATPFADHRFDMIFANLSLPWCDWEKAMNEFHRLLAPGGVLLFSLYGRDTLIEIREAWFHIDDHPHVHDFPDMHNIGDALLVAGLTEPVVDVDNLRLTYPAVEKLWQDLKQSGSVCVHPQRRKSLTGRHRFQHFQQALIADASAQNPLAITMEIIYGQAWAPTNVLSF